MVEAAGVEPDKAAENTQLVDRGNARIGTNCITSKSAVQSLYSVLPEFQNTQLPPSDALVQRKAF
jgi:hypothetical protein